MSASGEGETEAIRAEFDPSIMVDFQGAKITSDTGFILLREIAERLGISGPMGTELEDTRSWVHSKHAQLHMLRQFYLSGDEVKRSMEWLIKRMIKVGAKVAYHGRKWQVHEATAFPLAHHYRATFA